MGNTKDGQNLYQKCSRILEFLQNPPAPEPLLGHKDLLFFKDQAHYYADFALKRVLLSSAITDVSKQKVYLGMSSLILRKFFSHYDIVKVETFIEENVSFTAGFNVTEKKHFTFAYFYLRLFLLSLTKNFIEIPALVSKFGELCLKNALFKLYLGGLIEEMQPNPKFLSALVNKCEFLNNPVSYQDYCLLLEIHF